MATRVWWNQEGPAAIIDLISLSCGKKAFHELMNQIQPDNQKLDLFDTSLQEHSCSVVHVAVVVVVAVVVASGCQSQMQVYTDISLGHTTKHIETNGPLPNPHWNYLDSPKSTKNEI